MAGTTPGWWRAPRMMCFVCRGQCTRSQRCRGRLALEQQYALASQDQEVFLVGFPVVPAHCFAFRETYRFTPT